MSERLLPRGGATGCRQCDVHIDAHSSVPCVRRYHEWLAAAERERDEARRLIAWCQPCNVLAEPTDTSGLRYRCPKCAKRWECLPHATADALARAQTVIAKKDEALKCTIKMVYDHDLEEPLRPMLVAIKAALALTLDPPPAPEAGQDRRTT